MICHLCKDWAEKVVLLRRDRDSLIKENVDLLNENAHLKFKLLKYEPALDEIPDDWEEHA